MRTQNQTVHGDPVRVLRFNDLKDRGVVKNWQTLRRWIDNADFPPGFRLGVGGRAWFESDIVAWLRSRPQIDGSGGTR